MTWNEGIELFYASSGPQLIFDKRFRTIVQATFEIGVRRVLRGLQFCPSLLGTFGKTETEQRVASFHEKNLVNLLAKKWYVFSISPSLCKDHISC